MTFPHIRYQAGALHGTHGEHEPGGGPAMFTRQPCQWDKDDGGEKREHQLYPQHIDAVEDIGETETGDEDEDIERHAGGQSGGNLHLAAHP